VEPMNSRLPEEELFETMAERAGDPEAGPLLAPARLKARIYSALIKRQQESGPLRSLAETKAGGAKLCIFEEAWTLAALGDEMKCLNLCRVCHARLLAEKMYKAPIYWSGCPYADFHKA
jgi:hypothetical protein